MNTYYEKSVPFSRDLAMLIGVDKAIMVCVLEDKLNNDLIWPIGEDGNPYLDIYTYKELTDEFRFWQAAKVTKVFKALLEDGIVYSYQKPERYRINWDKITQT